MKRNDYVFLGLYKVKTQKFQLYIHYYNNVNIFKMSILKD